MKEKKRISDAKMPETDMPDRVPLVFVILAFAIIQPVGMLLLGIRKLQNTGILIKEGRSMLTISVVFIILFFSLLDYPELSNFFTIFYFIGSCGVIALLFSLLIFRQGQRCEKYKSAIMTHHLTQISDIASAVKQPEPRVLQRFAQNDEREIFSPSGTGYRKHDFSGGYI